MSTLTAPREHLRSGTARPPALFMDEVTKTYDGAHTALDRVSLEVARGTFLAVMGPSGSGKSTLLHCAAGLDDPTGGEVSIGGTRISGLSETKRTRVRRARVGFVFQSYNLLPSLTVEENLTLPLRLAGADADRRWLRHLVERVGIAELLHRRPAELSGGQQQRAAIARSLAARPAVVFADEPTGALDVDTAAEVLDLLRELVDEWEQTVVMVTHDPAAAARAHATCVMVDGRIDAYLPHPDAAELAQRLTTLGLR
ncbi:ABC transporter ATP-binding protein [Glycomyces sp. TRM65418]|uniref:ABC transporter ATP-binding protein n=1 Tax=Glycomyces sp. TRM65418 TaxID=2867006 RepID=UPI001CE6E6CC|nr:ABC transporter ATP-binding protein [Glycomyces sp. TRM65418]MCC3763571.1 ABC transporter ATP-binding protein [Glycomyces sp. TRM65418]QZD57555.1 ABC transporter ATP-binding protein [Glycomyces sp. TRM65418]